MPLTRKGGGASASSDAASGSNLAESLKPSATGSLPFQTLIWTTRSVAVRIAGCALPRESTVIGSSTRTSYCGIVVVSTTDTR